MPRTRADYVSLMEHALGAVPDSRHTLADTLNDAGRALFDAHEWSWRQRTAGVDFVASQTYITLPTGCGQIISAERVGGTGRAPVRLTSLADIIRLRNTSENAGTSWHLATDFGVDQTGVTVLATQDRAAIYPTPAANESGAIELTYRLDWTVLDDDTDVPNMPASHERALVLLSRAFAIHLEDQEAAFEDEAFQAELDRLIDRDGGRQVDYGTYSGPRIGSERGVIDYPHDTISLP